MTAMPVDRLEPDGGPHIPDEILEWVAASAGATALQMAQHLQRGGADPAESMRLLGPLMLVQARGPGVLQDLGLPSRSSERIRARLADLIANAGDPVPPVGSPGAFRGNGRRAAR